MKSTKQSIEAFAQIIHHSLIWIIVASYFLAAWLPGFGIWIREVELGSLIVGQNKLDFSLPPLMLSLLLFNAGLGVKTRELAELAHKPLMLISGLSG
ncbi:MAG: Na+-dependent transporter, partial [Methylococcales bacterium]